MNDTLTALRKPRVAGVAVFDAAASLFAAVLVGVFFLRLGDDVVDWTTFLIAWVALGVVVHYLVGQRTTLGTALGL